ncbi:hypothetical protein BJ508DRAFT_310480 [Ascobolus immersus RN42]|uniref:Ty3 transposon capsid-like protein domain-containing protein n=1 Tax=Ascobolus immersus RN42 TaxID=1160509 RepID=A0A3N4HUZ0_ASCIM|nr:hypothetical protein BJ508DRAFT_310480 [Ascobolus immersus RN42]
MSDAGNSSTDAAAKISAGVGGFPASTPAREPYERPVSAPPKHEKTSPYILPPLNTNVGASSKTDPLLTPTRRNPGDQSPLSGTSSARLPFEGDDDEMVIIATSHLPRPIIPKPRRINEAYTGLLTALEDSNEALHTSLLQDVLNHNTIANNLGHNGITIVDALNKRLDEIRDWARHCRTTVKTLASQQEDTDRRYQTAKAELARLQAAPPTTPLNPAPGSDVPQIRVFPETPPTQPGYPTREGPIQYVMMQPSVTSPHIGEIPKTLSVPLQTNPVPNYNGSGDVESIFNFLKALQHHIRLLPHFTDLQRINYAQSYMQGSVSQWASEWQVHRPVGSWQRFLREFKQEWLPSTHTYYLSQKLQNMTLKSASQIDQFNYEYQSTLELLDITDLNTVTEGHPYFTLYLTKINNQSIQMAIQLQAHQSSLDKKPFTLKSVMRYVSRLFAAKALQAVTSAAPKPASKTAPPHRRQPTIRNIETTSAEEEEEAEALDLHAAQPRYATPTYVRRCHLCMALNHLMRECPLKPGLDALRRRKGSEKDKKDEPKGKD